MPPPKVTPRAWAQERLAEVFACALLCHALRIPHSANPAVAVDAALADPTLERVPVSNHVDLAVLLQVDRLAGALGQEFEGHRVVAEALAPVLTELAQK